MTDGNEPLAFDDVGNGPVVVFIHGLTFCRRTWDPIVARLRDRFRCIAIDLPGHGDSSGSGAEPFALAQRLHETLVRLDVAAPVVIGHSAGTMVATGYAARFPVAGVVDVDQPMLAGGFARMVQQLAPLLRGRDFTGAFAPFEQSIGVDRLPEPERSRVTATRRIDQHTVLDHWHLPLTTPPDEVQALVDGLLGDITVPFLYVGGDELPAPAREHLDAHLHQPEIVVWSGRGHLVHLAEPERFAGLVAAFCDRLPTSGSSRSETRAG